MASPASCLWCAPVTKAESAASNASSEPAALEEFRGLLGKALKQVGVAEVGRYLRSTVGAPDHSSLEPNPLLGPAAMVT